MEGSPLSLIQAPGRDPRPFQRGRALDAWISSLGLNSSTETIHLIFSFYAGLSTASKHSD